METGTILGIRVSQIGDPCLEVTVVRIIMFGGLCWSPTIYDN